MTRRSFLLRLASVVFPLGAASKLRGALPAPAPIKPVRLDAFDMNECVKQFAHEEAKRIRAEFLGQYGRYQRVGYGRVWHEDANGCFVARPEGIVG